MRAKPSLTRREALQGLGLAGITAVVSACGSTNGSRAATATVAPLSTSTPLPPHSPTVLPSSTVVAPTSTSEPTVASSTTPTHTRTATPSEAPTTTPTQATPTATRTIASPACILSPEQTQGPFFLDLDLLRSDIREDRAGARLRLSLQLVDADGCAPIRDALVHIWHADAAGVYSGFAGQTGGVDTTGQTFLRGYQVTDANGVVEFTTIYPGWYQGRTVHIHFLARLDASSLITTQMYFDESLSDSVFAQAPYNTRGQRGTTNATDGIIRSGGVQSLDEVIVNVVDEAPGYAASMVIGVGA